MNLKIALLWCTNLINSSILYLFVFGQLSKMIIVLNWSVFSTLLSTFQTLENYISRESISRYLLTHNPDFSTCSHAKFWYRELNAPLDRRFECTTWFSHRWLYRYNWNEKKNITVTYKAAKQSNSKHQELELFWASFWLAFWDIPESALGLLHSLASVDCWKTALCDLETLIDVCLIFRPGK